MRTWSGTAIHRLWRTSRGRRNRRVLPSTAIWRIGLVQRAKRSEGEAAEIDDIEALAGRQREVVGKVDPEAAVQARAPADRQRPYCPNLSPAKSRPSAPVAICVKLPVMVSGASVANIETIPLNKRTGDIEVLITGPEIFIGKGKDKVQFYPY